MTFQQTHAPTTHVTRPETLPTSLVRCSARVSHPPSRYDFLPTSLLASLDCVQIPFPHKQAMHMIVENSHG